MQMEDYLYQKDLYLSLGEKAKQPATMKDEEWDGLDRKELGTIRLCMPSSVAFNISKENTTEGMMSAFARIYEKPLASNHVFLMKCLFNMNMSEGGSIAHHLNEFNMLTSQLSSVKVNFDDEVRDLLILCSFPECWNSLFRVVCNFVPSLNTLKFDDVIGVILRDVM